MCIDGLSGAIFPTTIARRKCVVVGLLFWPCTPPVSSVRWLHFLVSFPSANAHRKTTPMLNPKPLQKQKRPKKTQRMLTAHTSCAHKCKHCADAAQILRSNRRNGLQPCCLGVLWLFQGAPFACIGCTVRPICPTPMDTNSTAKAHSRQLKFRATYLKCG